MGKVLHIKDCYFRLPEDFNGTCGDALMLLALRRLEQEKEQNVVNRTNSAYDLYDFWNSDEKCMLTYYIGTEEQLKTEKENKLYDK